jgi:hypothetical protein
VDTFTHRPALPVAVITATQTSKTKETVEKLKNNDCHLELKADMQFLAPSCCTLFIMYLILQSPVEGYVPPALTISKSAFLAYFPKK